MKLHDNTPLRKRLQMILYDTDNKNSHKRTEANFNPYYFHIQKILLESPSSKPESWASVIKLNQYWNPCVNKTFAVEEDTLKYGHIFKIYHETVC